MAPPIATKTWFYNVNNKQAVAGSSAAWHKELLLAIKDALVNSSPTVPWTDDTGATAVPAGIWTVDHCSDAVAAGTPGDGVDRWLDTGDLISFAPGNSHSWMVFKTGANGGVAEYLIDLSNNNSGGPDSNNEFMEVQVNWEGDLAGGTLNDAPTGGTTFSEIITGVTDNIWAGGFNEFDIVWHLMMSSDGEEMRLFMMRNNVCFGIWLFGELADPPVTPLAADQRNWFATIWNAAKATPNEAGGFETSNGLLHGSESNRIICGIGDTVKPMTLQDGGGGANPWLVAFLGGTGDEIQDLQTFGEISLWEYLTSGSRGPKGRIKDFWVVKDDRQLGTTYPNDGTRQFHQIGANIAVPWNSEVPENTF